MTYPRPHFDFCLCCCLALLLTSTSFGQDRENLKQPTYRVSNNEVSTDAVATANSAQPTPTPVPTGQPLSTATEQPTAEIASAQPLGTPLATKAAPELPEAEIVFRRAMQDAEQMLAMIRQDVKDYQCVFVKRENVKGKIIGPQYMLAKVRNRQMDGNKVVVPFSVYMKFLKPTCLKGREALYVENVKNGKILCKEGGTKGKWLPSIYLPTTSKYVLADNRYPITEFGIENLTKRLLDRGRADSNIHDCNVVFKRGATVCGRNCRYLEVRRDHPKQGRLNEHEMNVPLARVFVDEELNIPIRYVAYDWPKKNQTDLPILEEYTYQNLQLNVGLTDADFHAKNPAFGF